MIKAVIFDFGGVLETGAGSSYKLYENIAGFLGTDSQCVSDNARELDVQQLQTGEITEEEFWHTLSHRLKISLPSDYQKKIQNWYAAEFSFNQEMIEIAASARGKGYRTAILSNTIPSHLSVWKPPAEAYGFSPIIASCEVGIRKPEEAIYRLAMKKLEIGKGEGVYVDDNEEFLRPAERVGLVPILALNATQVKSEFQRLGIV